MALSSASIAVTMILDLNDDCLLAVFEHLSGFHLCIIADVCRRFRKNAQIQFPSVRLNYFRRLHLFQHDQDASLKSIVRHFGPFIESIKLDGRDDTRTMEMLSRHCMGQLFELQLYNYEYGITKIFAESIRPLLSQIQILKVCCADIGNHILKMLPIWSPKLRWLDINRSNEKCSNGLHQNFPELESISFQNIRFFKFKDVEKMLKNNSQLKQIEILNCGLSISNEDIFRAIARYVPRVETISFGELKVTDVKNIKCFGQLMSLNSLSVSNCGGLSSAAFNEMAAVNVPLTSLRINGLSLETDSMVDGISKLKNLEYLTLYRSHGIKFTHILDLCTKLKELSEIQLTHTGNGFETLTWDNILQIIQNAGKLRKILYLQKDNFFRGDLTVITADKYKQTLDIVEKRQSKIPLQIVLAGDFYKVDIPHVNWSKHTIIQFDYLNCNDRV